MGGWIPELVWGKGGRSGGLGEVRNSLQNKAGAEVKVPTNSSCQGVSITSHHTSFAHKHPNHVVARFFYFDQKC